MRYDIRFAGDAVGGVPIQPFSVDVTDDPAVSIRTSDLGRRIRARVAAAISPGMAVTPGVVESLTQVVCELSAGEGSAHYGTRTLGHFSITAVN